MKLINAFQKLLMEFSQKEVKHYIGLGNPNAKILIIGKEYASNHNKAGFVAIVGDKWQIGIGQDDSIKGYVKPTMAVCSANLPSYRQDKYVRSSLP